MFENTTTFINTLGVLVTAVATFFLWRVTALLAKETKRMADFSDKPQIVAVIRSNQWTMMYADLIISNTGNASAFDIKVVFNPPLLVDDEDVTDDQAVPLQRISVLRPSESLSSDIGKAYPLLDRNYIVTTSWLRQPDSDVRDHLSYELNLADFKGVTQLGAADPLIQIANEVKHIRDDWRPVAGGSRKLSADVFTEQDRLRQRRERDREHAKLKKMMAAQAAQERKNSASSSSDDPAE